MADRSGIGRKRPLLVQLSRFDRFEDPSAPVRAYRAVRQTFDCKLLLLGAGAQDDPKGARVLAEAREPLAENPGICVPGPAVESGSAGPLNAG